MAINKNHPKFIPFMKNERNTLEWLSNNSYVTSNFRPLALSAYNSLSTFPKKEKYFANFTLHFSCKLELSVEGRAMTTILECQVQNEFGLATYCFSVCDGVENPLNLIRKFHFDYAKPTKNDPEPKPVYHWQYGGQESAGLQELGIEIDNLQPWLSSPRLFCTPINLALFLDLIFCEFRDISTRRLTESNEWRQLVKSNEDKLLTPYIENLGSFLVSNHSSEYLLRDFHYGI